MCYFLHIASPLTLSEVRAMLPTGLSAHAVGAEDRRMLRQLLPAAQTVAQLRIGGCSCDLVRRRHPDRREDERPLRARYRELGLPRADVIRALEQHRQGEESRPEPPEGWPAALAGFVAEHARNAGATLYYLHFDPRPLHLRPGTLKEVRTVPAAAVRAGPDWLEAGRATTVIRW